MKYLRCLEVTSPEPEMVERVLRGSIDMHIHIAPDKKARRVDALQCAIAAQDAGMRAVVLKSTCYRTTPLAYVTKHLAPDVKCFGSICLDYEVTGGLCDSTAIIVENHARLGAKMLWMPVTSAEYARRFTPGLEGTGIHILDSHAKLRPEVIKVLEIIKNYDMVLGSGHISYEEAAVLFKTAGCMGITKMVTTHPLSDVIWDAMSMEQIKQLVRLGAYFEVCYLSCTPMNGREDLDNIVNAIREIGPEHTILSSDMSQITDPTPAEGMRSFIAHMLQYGFSEEEVSCMVKTNPAVLLNLDIEI